MLPSFSVVIPAFNEASRIGQTVRATLDYLQEVNPRNELIVVNDGSTDATGTIAREVLSGAKIAVRLLENFPNRGKGAAVRTARVLAQGVAEAGGELGSSWMVRMSLLTEGCA